MHKAPMRDGLLDVASGTTVNKSCVTKVWEAKQKARSSQACGDIHIDGLAFATEVLNLDASLQTDGTAYNCALLRPAM
jgi:hypothetical protein